MRFFKQMVYGELPLGSEPLDTLGKIRTRIELINWYVGMDRENILALLRMYKKQHAEHFGVIRIGVFGSVARGTLKDGSDVDIVVELNKRNLLNNNEAQSRSFKGGYSEFFFDQLML
jgi:hypothetical protein